MSKPLFEEVLTPVTKEDFSQAKLTINFQKKMWVIEELLNKGGSD